MIDYEQRGRVAVLTINRPEARNAVNGDVASAMEAHIDRIEEDEGTWLGVVTGAGPVVDAGTRRPDAGRARVLARGLLGAPAADQGDDRDDGQDEDGQEQAEEVSHASRSTSQRGPGRARQGPCVPAG